MCKFKHLSHTGCTFVWVRNQVSNQGRVGILTVGRKPYVCYMGWLFFFKNTTSSTLCFLWSSAIKRNELGKLMNLLVLIFQLFNWLQHSQNFINLAFVLSEDLENWKSKSFTILLGFVRLNNFLPLLMYPYLSEIRKGGSNAAAVILPKAAGFYLSIKTLSVHYSTAY